MTKQPSKSNKLFDYSSQNVVLAGENVTFYEKKPNCKRITTTLEDEPDAEGFTIPANFPSVELWEADNYTLSGGG